MDKILGAVGSVPTYNARNDDDFSDRLSHRYTSMLLIAFAVIVSTSQYVGDPITCWVPAHFTGNHEEYTNNYCWVKNTYYLPFQEHIPKEHEQRSIIPYYQWMPIILLLQALLFYLPVMLWRSLNTRSGINVNSIVEAGEALQNAGETEARDTTLKFMVKQMDRYLSSQEQYSHRAGCTVSVKQILASTICRLCGRRHGNYLVFLYIIVKLIFIANVVGQIFALNVFLGHDFNMYGIFVVQSLLRGDEWTENNRFPRVTMCDFKIRRLGNVQRYTVQCVLPINLFNEKIYLFIWFWMVLLATTLCFSLCKWIIKSVFKVDRHRYIKRHLRLMELTKAETRTNTVTKFVNDYLKADGVFVLRLIGFNTNTLTVTEFISALYENYEKKKDESRNRQRNLNSSQM